MITDYEHMLISALRYALVGKVKGTERKRR